MNKDVSDKAKPCPMCGGKDIYIEIGDLYPLYTMYIKCTKCGLKGWKNFLLPNTSTEEGEEKLIKYWNTRKLEKKPKTIASSSYNAGYETGHKDGFAEGFKEGMYLAGVGAKPKGSDENEN